MIGLESFRLSPQTTESLSSSSPCSVALSDDGKDGYGVHLNSLNQQQFDFQLTPELTRLDMVSSALEWLETLDSSQQTRPDPTQMSAPNVSMQEQPCNMIKYKNTSFDFDVSAAVAFSKPAATKHVLFPQPEAASSGSNFSHSLPQQKMKSPDSANFVTQCHSKDPGSDKEWKRGRCSVPDEFKDERYWRKRSRNNMSAKKSREAKRLKDLSIARKIDELEKENAMLKMMLANLMVQQEQQQQQQQQRPQQQRHMVLW